MTLFLPHAALNERPTPKEWRPFVLSSKDSSDQISNGPGLNHFDSDYPLEEQLPRKFDTLFLDDGNTLQVSIDGKPIGSPLSDKSRTTGWLSISRRIPHLQCSNAQLVACDEELNAKTA